MPNYRQDRLRVSTGVERARGDTVSAQEPGQRQGMSPLPRPVLVRRCVSAQRQPMLMGYLDDLPATSRHRAGDQ